ncbi:MAG: carboxypeptidase regulatory-like domain-containing protein [Acidobacteriia bacterium]|nr:carboxypeptidase regulatory-like domain-containing protein [Terriglobia bacterium]
MSQPRKLGLCLLLIAITLMPLPAFAQSQANTGAIEGTVTDPSGSAVPNAAVTLTNVGTNFTREILTDSEGRFRGLLLPLGPYKVTVKAPNFATIVREGLDLAVGQTIALALALSISQVDQVISVTGEAPILESGRVESSTYLDQRSVRDLPNNGRNFLSLVPLTPGVSIVQGPDGDEISINGQKGINNNVSIDGADNNNPFFGEQRGGQRPAFTVSLDAVKEFQVVADNAPAEFGRSSGGFINVVTKSGTNELHGTLHEYQKWTGLTSRLSDGTRVSGFSQEQFGGTVGGAIRKDKLFYFAAYDQQFFTQTKQNNPARIDPALVNFFATKFNDPNENGPITRQNNAIATLGKIDWYASQKNLFTVRYNFARARQPNGTFDVDQWGGSANAIERDFSNTVSTQLNTTISATTLNEARFQFSREDRPRDYTGPSLPGQSRPLPDTGIDFVGQYRFGLPFFIPVKDHDTRFQANDNLSVVHGAHNIKMGVELNRTSTTQTFLGFANGRFIFDSVQGFINYVNIGPKFVECSDGSTNNNGVCPSNTTITGPLQLFLQFAGVNGLATDAAGTQTIPQLEPALFVQDKWQIRPNLTLSYGLRWDAQIEPDPITAPSQVFFAPFIGKPGFPSTGLIPSSKKQFQPRLGIVWDPAGKGKTLIRVGGGIYYARTPGLDLASIRSTNGSVGQSIFRASFFNGFGVTPPAYTDLIPNASNLAPDHPDVYVADKNYSNPRTYTWNVTVEQAVTTSLKMTAAFTYAKGVHETRFVNRNDPVFGSPWSTGLGADKTNGIGTLWTEESSAKSLYRSLTLGMQKQLSNHFQFQMNYQLSEDLADDDNERDPFTLRYAVANNFQPEYGFSDRNERHRFNAFGLWEGPWGIEFSPLISFHSPQPKSVGVTPQDRILPSGGIIRRNTLWKDNTFFAIDFRADKNFKLSERFKLQASVDAFNLTNRANPKHPETTGLLFNFDGTVQSGLGDPRQAQLGLRLVF